MSMPDFKKNYYPVDRVAARVVFQKGESWAPEMKQRDGVTYELPPLPKKTRPADAVDYTGFRRGFLTAFRYHDSASVRGASWLCKCDCGRYELRRIKKWTERPNIHDACEVCQKSFYIANGRRFDQSDMKTKK